MKRGLLVFMLVLTGCIDFADSLDAYCTGSHVCECADGACCIVSGGVCGSRAPCCEGLVCAAGRCTPTHVPVLRIDPATIDLQAENVPPGTRGPIHQLWVENTGDAPTTELVLEATDTFHFFVDGSDCAGQVLAPGDRCPIHIAAQPFMFGPRAMTLRVTSGKAQAEATITYRSGDLVTVTRQGSGHVSVTSSSGALTCPGHCSGEFTRGDTVALTAHFDAGTSFLGFTGAPCAEDGGTQCTFVVDGGVTLTAVSDAWLDVVVHAPDAGYPFRPSAVSAAPDLQCVDRCEFAVGGTVELVAQPTVAQGFERWEGTPCVSVRQEGGVSICTVELTGPAQVQATFARSNRIFVAYAPSIGSVGGLQAADAACQEAADRAGLGDEIYRAWLAAPGADVRERFKDAAGWVRASGAPIARTLEDLIAGRLFYTVADESGDVATGGSPGSGLDCTGWTSTTGSWRGGRSYANGPAWYDDPSVQGKCDSAATFYCVGASRRHALTFGPTGAKRAFLSSPWRPGGGSAGADAHCTVEANGAGYTGQFKAELTGIYKPFHGNFERLDGVRVGDTIFLQPLEVAVDGGHVVVDPDPASGTMAWLGRDANCDGWTSQSGTGSVTRPDLGTGYLQPRAVAGHFSCSTAQRLFCFEQ